MNIENSVVLPNCFPQTRTSLDEMIRVLHFLAQHGIRLAELFFEGMAAADVKQALQNTGLKSYYVAIVPLKERNLSLCSLDEQDRMAAIQVVKDCIDVACALGSDRVMISSGRIPDRMEDIPRACDAFCQSIEASWAYAKSVGGEKPPVFSLEPCDSSVQAKNLLGSTALTVEVCQRLEKRGIPLWLAMDTAHIVEEGEDVLSALRLSEKYCDHVHFANCVMCNKSHPMYGDKHVYIDLPEAEFNARRFQEIRQEFPAIYGGKTVKLAIEYVCRSADCYQTFTEQFKLLQR